MSEIDDIPPGNLVFKKIKNKAKEATIRIAFLVTIILFVIWQIETNRYVQAKEFLFGNNTENSALMQMSVVENNNFGKISESFLPENISQKMRNLQSGEKEKMNPDKSGLKIKLQKMTENYPIEEMVPYIVKYDNQVAALIVGIAKKESNWGKRSPVKNGKTCYNYWGYKGQSSRGTSMGYACFSSPEEAVKTIGERIKKLTSQGLNTPAKMIVWKCGRSCAGHSPSGVKKWISDVGLYYNRIMTRRES